MATNIPILSQSQSVNAITEAEAGILQCLQTFLCATLIVITPEAGDDLLVVKDKIDISKSLICAMTAKEKSIAKVLDGLANKILADKGLVPGGNGNENGCDC